VYKIKKPVSLGFLDFTTLARRRRFCHDEVRLNRRLASDVYLDVVEIKGSARAPRFEGRGRTIEVAVLMRRLPAERMLDRLVRENTAPAALLDGIGTTVARFHAAADTGGEIDEVGGILVRQAARPFSEPCLGKLLALGMRAAKRALEILATAPLQLMAYRLKNELAPVLLQAVDVTDDLGR